MSVTLQSASAGETTALGEQIGRQLNAGDVVLLHGDLGSGKTTIAQGILAGLDVAGPIPSPTFTLVNEYGGTTRTGDAVRIYHLDLYRLGSESDLDSIGLDDYLAPTDGITLVEWPERAATHFESGYLLVEFTLNRDDQRQVRITPNRPDSERFAWLSSLSEAADDDKSAGFQPGL